MVSVAIPWLDLLGKDSGSRSGLFAGWGTLSLSAHGIQLFPCLNSTSLMSHSPLVEPMKGGLLWRGATHEAQQSLCTHAPDSSATRGPLRRTHDRWHWRWPRPAAQSGPNRPQPQGVIVRRYLLLPGQRPGAGRRVVQLRRGERSHQSEAASNQHSAVRQQCRRVKPASLHQVAGRRPGAGRRVVRLG